MKEIRLLHGSIALVDDQDFEWLSEFTWFEYKASRGRVYAARFFAGRVQGMHRAITEASPEQQVDHANGKSLDNRRENLRPCTRAENSANVRVIRSKSGFKGVYASGKSKPWRAGIKCQQKCISLGYFATPDEAALAYDQAALHYFGDFAATNADLLGMGSR